MNAKAIGAVRHLPEGSLVYSSTRTVLMEAFLGVIGSIASLVAIPLGFYFYFRSREAADQAVRREIARILSYQLGEDRVLTAFEVRSVIDSKLQRASHAARCYWSGHEMVNDLVAETIANPMLDSQKKSRILDNLRSITDSSQLFRIISRYRIEPPDLVRLLEILRVRLLPEDSALAKQSDITADIINRAGLKEIEVTIHSRAATNDAERKSRFLYVSSTVFAFLASIATAVAALLLKSGFTNRITLWFSQNQYLANFLLGAAGASFLAAIVTYYFGRFGTKSADIEQSQDETAQSPKDPSAD